MRSLFRIFSLFQPGLVVILNYIACQTIFSVKSFPISPAKRQLNVECLVEPTFFNNEDGLISAILFIYIWFSFPNAGEKKTELSILTCDKH